MNPYRHHLAIVILVLGAIGLTAQATDRMRPGQWNGVTVVNGKNYETSTCMSQHDADAMNGDARAVLAYLQTIIPPEVCKITDVKVDAVQVIYTATCGTRPPKVVTTAYHGDHFEGTDTTGTKTGAKLVGPCKRAAALDRP